MANCQFQTTTKFEEIWAGKGLFKGSINETEMANPGFQFFYNFRKNKRLMTKPPIIFIENYDFSSPLISAGHSVNLNQLFFLLPTMQCFSLQFRV